MKVGDKVTLNNRALDALTEEKRMPKIIKKYYTIKYIIPMEGDYNYYYLDDFFLDKNRHGTGFFEDEIDLYIRRIKK